MAKNKSKVLEMMIRKFDDIIAAHLDKSEAEELKKKSKKEDPSDEDGVEDDSKD